MKKLQLSDLIVFYGKYFNVKNYVKRCRPSTKNIIGFLCYHEIKITEKAKEILAMFVWDFWNTQDVQGLNTAHLNEFCAAHNISSVVVQDAETHLKN
jgi:hypothetical protein